MKVRTAIDEGTRLTEGLMMATSESNGMDQKAHVSTYSGFLNMAKWGTIVTVVIVAVVVLLISN